MHVMTIIMQVRLTFQVNVSDLASKTKTRRFATELRPNLIKVNPCANLA